MTLTVAGRTVTDEVGIWTSYARRVKTLRDYDLSDPGRSHVLTEAEVWRTRIIGSRLTKADLAYILERAISAPWDAVRADAVLADADPLIRSR